MRRWAAALAVALAGCAPSPPPAAGEAGTAPDPVAFFTGASHGTGQVNMLWGERRTLRVTSRGTAGPDGSLILDQQIALGGKSPRTRRWTMRPVAPGRWTGALTDADGPVAVVAKGRALHIRYRSTEGLTIDQWLVPIGPDRLDNRMTIRKAGLVVARLDEVITRD